MATREIDRFPVWLVVFILAWLLACLRLFKEPARAAIFHMVQYNFSLAAAACLFMYSYQYMGW
jgi:hypothetical protein